MTKQAHRASSEAGRKVNRRFSKTVGLIAAALVASLLCGQAATAQSLPAEAKEEMERGLAAVRSQAWEVAIKHFEGARKHAPDDPALMFNLGLAHGRAGHDLLASTWLRAYLARTPQAANAGAVRKEILDREAVVEATVERLFQRANKITAEQPDDVWLHENVARAYAAIGKYSEAREAIDRFPNNPHGRARAYSDLALRHIAAGQRDEALAALFDYLAASNDLPDSDWQKALFQSDVAEKQYRLGLREEARPNLQNAYASALRVPRKTKNDLLDFRSIALLDISETFFLIGDLESARSAAEKMEPSYFQKPDFSEKWRAGEDSKYEKMLRELAVPDCFEPLPHPWQQWARVASKLGWTIDPAAEIRRRYEKKGGPTYYPVVEVSKKTLDVAVELQRQVNCARSADRR